MVIGTGREGFPKSEAEDAGGPAPIIGTNLLGILTEAEESRTETWREGEGDRFLEEVKPLDPAVPEGGAGLPVG